MEHVIEYGAFAPGRGVIMPMNYVTKDRRKSTDTSSKVEVITIIRTQPFEWLATAVYTRGTTVWVETVEFHVTHDVSTTPSSRIVRITDGDHHGDRAHVSNMDRYDERSIAQFIIDYLEAGRW